MTLLTREIAGVRIAAAASILPVNRPIAAVPIVLAANRRDVKRIMDGVSIAAAANRRDIRREIAAVPSVTAASVCVRNLVNADVNMALAVTFLPTPRTRPVVAIVCAASGC